MTAEVTVLALAGLWQGVHFVLLSAVANSDLGPRWLMSPRDAPPPHPPGRLTGRLERALTNHVHALALFAGAVLAVTLAGNTGPFTAACAWVFLAARLAYLPAYAFGWAPWRSLIFALGLAATLLIYLAALA